MTDERVRRLRVIGGGAMNATDKIFQDNSLGGKYNITGFYAHTFGTFYQSCGNCLNQAKRNATIEKSIALFGTRLGIISPNCMFHVSLKFLQSLHTARRERPANELSPLSRRRRDPHQEHLHPEHHRASHQGDRQQRPDRKSIDIARPSHRTHPSCLKPHADTSSSQ